MNIEKLPKHRVYSRHGQIHSDNGGLRITPDLIADPLDNELSAHDIPAHDSTEYQNEQYRDEMNALFSGEEHIIVYMLFFN